MTDDLPVATVTIRRVLTSDGRDLVYLIRRYALLVAYLLVIGYIEVETFWLHTSTRWTALLAAALLFVLAYDRAAGHVIRNLRQLVLDHKGEPKIVAAEFAPVDASDMTTGLWCPTCAKPSGIEYDACLYVAGTTTLLSRRHVRACADCMRYIEENA